MMQFGIGILLFNTPETEYRALHLHVNRGIEEVVRVFGAKGIAVQGNVYVLDNSTGSADYSDKTKSVWPIEISARNLGFGAGHNHMMKQCFDAGNDHYIMMNPDGFPHIDCLSEMVMAAISDPGVGQVEALQFPQEHPKPWDPLTFETAWSSGACSLLTREAYAYTGGFDDNFFMYCEDVDLSWRLRSIGYRIKMAPKALFFHDVRSRSNRATRRAMLMSGRYLARKWGAPDFERHTEECLVGEGYFAHPAYIPQVPVPPQYFPHDGIAEFRQLFSFAVPRW
jgi:GT2 family glycosyltransferase